MPEVAPVLKMGEQIHSLKECQRQLKESWVIYKKWGQNNQRSMWLQKRQKKSCFKGLSPLTQFDRTPGRQVGKIYFQLD